MFFQFIMVGDTDAIDRSMPCTLCTHCMRALPPLRHNSLLPSICTFISFLLTQFYFTSVLFCSVLYAATLVTLVLLFIVVQCNAIFFTSFPVYGIQGIPSFHPLAMMGGALWCTGNMMCGPIIQLIGMGMGLLIWGCANMVTDTTSTCFTEEKEACMTGLFTPLYLLCCFVLL